MRFMTITAALPRPGIRRVRMATASLVSAAMLILASPGAAHAHHGFDDFDTARPYYIAGAVSEVRWGEPHSYFTVTLDSDLPADTPERDLPDGLQDAADSDPIDAAPSYSGSHAELDVTIAPPSFTSMWGLDRELRDGERIEAVGYIGRSHDDEFRPVVFWVEDGQPINQVLNEELPATPMPTPYPDGEVPLAAAEDDSASTATDADTSAAAVWATLGVALLAVVAGGAVFLRSRSRRA